MWSSSAKLFEILQFEVSNNFSGNSEDMTHSVVFFFFQAEDGIRDKLVTGVQTCALPICTGEIVCLMGANGSGKSSLLNAVSGLVRPAAGTVVFEGRSLTDVPTYRRLGLGLAHVLERRRLFPYMTVLENLLLGSYLPAARARRGEALEQVFRTFPELRARRQQLAHTLSGGEQQMVAIARPDEHPALPDARRAVPRPVAAPRGRGGGDDPAPQRRRHDRALHRAGHPPVPHHLASRLHPGVRPPRPERDERRAARKRDAAARVHGARPGGAVSSAAIGSESAALPETRVRILSRLEKSVVQSEIEGKGRGAESVCCGSGARAGSFDGAFVAHC